MNRICNCDRVEVGVLFDAEHHCRRCWLWYHEPSFRQACGGDPALCVTPNPMPDLLPPRSTHVIEGIETGGFNGSIIRHAGRSLIVYRRGRAGSQIFIGKLGGGKVISQHALSLDHYAAKWGREDPRFFVYGGRLHVSYVGVAGRSGPTNMLFASLTDDLKVDKIVYPRLQERAAWEKNWSFFEQGGGLWAVYQQKPEHVILSIVNDVARVAYRCPNRAPWHGGHLRGGASPVRVGDEFWHWTHGQLNCAGRRYYSIGVTTFAARAPYNVKRQTVRPLFWQRQPDRIATWQAAIFPCGAVLENGVWHVSAGVADESVSVLEWSHQEVERVLAPAPAQDFSRWPMRARAARLLRGSDDVGVGDTVARNLKALGIDNLAAAYTLLTGRDCGCADRQRILNEIYPYER